MALHKADLIKIRKIFGLSYDGDRAELELRIKYHLNRVVIDSPASAISAASSGYATPMAIPAQPIFSQAPANTQAPIISQAPANTPAPIISQAPANTQAPTIAQAPLFRQAPANIKRSSIFGPPVIAHPSPPDAPPLTDSDDDIVVTAEPM